MSTENKNENLNVVNDEELKNVAGGARIRGTKLTCVNCGSTNVKGDATNGYECNSCHHVWGTISCKVL